jgi:chromate reductase
MLETLRTVLSTVSSGFDASLFFRLAVMNKAPEQILKILETPSNRQVAERLLSDFASFSQKRLGENPNIGT